MSVTSIAILSFGINVTVLAMSAALYWRTKQRVFASLAGIFLSHLLAFELGSNFVYGAFLGTYALIASYCLMTREVLQRSVLRTTLNGATTFLGIGLCAKYFFTSVRQDVVSPEYVAQWTYALSYLAFAVAFVAILWNWYRNIRPLGRRLWLWNLGSFLLVASAQAMQVMQLEFSWTIGIGEAPALLAGVGGAVLFWTLLMSYVDNQADILDLTRKIRDRLLFDRNQQEKKLADAEGKLTNEKIKSINSARKVALGEMAGGIAHEINNPLAIIRCYADFLQSNIDVNDIIKVDERTQSAFQALNRGIDRIADIVNNMRKLAADSATESKEKIALGTVIDSAVQFCQKRFLTHNVALEVARVPSDIMVRGEMQQLTQVVLNLLQNSFKAVSKLDESWISIDYRIKEDRIQLRITDSGEGIDSSIAERIFQPFFTTSPSGQGVGLGLSIAQGIVEGQGGLLFLDRTCKNTRFIIELPMYREAAGGTLPASA
jgi:signal transduction histidine kinase